MGAEATGLINGKKTPALPPALPVVRARPRAGRVVDRDNGAAGASTPSLRTPVTVPFLWEDAPGRPKQLHGATVPGAPTVTAKIVVPADAGHDDDGDAKERPVPLKLPPRLQVPSSSMAERSLSPKTVLQRPYACTTRRPRRTSLRRSGSVASFRRTPSAGGGFFSRRKAEAATWIHRKSGRERHDDDASCSSPSASSASSSSSSSISFFGDDRGHGARRRPADPEEEGARASVRIMRLTRNRSLPSMTTSHLWASIRRSVKQIAPWS